MCVLMCCQSVNQSVNQLQNPLKNYSSWIESFIHVCPDCLSFSYPALKVPYSTIMHPMSLTCPLVAKIVQVQEKQQKNNWKILENCHRIDIKKNPQKLGSYKEKQVIFFHLCHSISDISVLFVTSRRASFQNCEF